MRKTLSQTILNEDHNRDGDLKVVQIIGEDHIGIAVEYLSLYEDKWLGVKIRDDYE